MQIFLPFTFFFFTFVRFPLSNMQLQLSLGVPLRPEPVNFCYIVLSKIQFAFVHYICIKNTSNYQIDQTKDVLGSN